MKPRWEHRRLGDLFRIQNGFAFDSKSFSNSAGVPLIRIRDLKNGANTETRYDGPYDDIYIVRAGDYLIGMDGEFGCFEWRGEPALLNQRVCKLCDFGAEIDPRFLFYGINRYLKEIEEHTTFTTVKHLSSKQIANILFPIPALAEQRRVVAILDKAFEAIATTTARAERNLDNAQDLFRSELRAVFLNSSIADVPVQSAAELLTPATNSVPVAKIQLDGATKTGGRAATARHVLGEFSLSVGMPKLANRNGWAWSPLEKLARMESGHTPSRRHPEYWGGTIPWVSIVDAKRAHGKTITDTLEHVTEDGIENSSARLLPAGTVCLSRTASIGYVTVLGRPMATSQDFVDWICSEALEPGFLKYLLLAQGDEFFKFSSGAVHQTIYFPEAKAFCIRHPDIETQRRIVDCFDFLKRETEKLTELCRAKLSALTELKRSILTKAFSGDLGSAVSTISPQFSASVLAFAYERHRRANQEKTFGRVKAQKLLHLVEATSGIDLGRSPIKDAAGPNDFQHMLRAEEWAEQNAFFRFRRGDDRYHFERLSKYNQHLPQAEADLNFLKAEVGRIVDLLLPMDSETTEVTATVYAAWNNLILDNCETSDEAIVKAARDDWHKDKLSISRRKFIDSIGVLRRAGIVPDGKAKRVGQRTLL